MFSSNTSQVSGGYEIQRSLRFNSADSAYLDRTPASAGNRKIWTWSGWVKRSALGTNQALMTVAGNSDSTTAQFWFGSDDKFYFGIETADIFITNAVFRDCSAWYHLVFAFDASNATSADKMILYVNGVRQTTSTYTAPSNTDYGFNRASAVHAIGRRQNQSDRYFNGYMTEVNFIDGQALTPSSFGAFDAQTGVWGPTPYAGSYGTNGFYLNFSDNSNTTAATLGKDYSGNSNNWTPNNFSVSAGAGNDSLVDVPTNWGTDTGVGGSVRGNYCTLNPLYGNPAPTNGNLDVTVNNTTVYGSLSFTSGKWYWEVTPTVVGGILYIGVMNSAYIKTDGAWGATTARTYVSNGTTFGSNGGTYGASYTANDIIGIALDMDAGSITFYKNGASQGTAFTNLDGNEWRPLVYASETSTLVCNFGQRPFAYTAPSGFRALNTQNLPTPTIGATTATQANKYFDVVLRNGGAPSGGTYSTTVNMANGALLWDKPRNLGANNYLVDSVRGISKNLRSNTVGAEATDASFFTGFNSSSFTTGSTDWGSSTTVVDWIWAANGSGISNTAGSITSTVSANTTSGFSIATFTTGNTSTQTWGHGLGVAPAMVITRWRNASDDLYVYHRSLGATQYIRLNTTGAAVTLSSIWNNTAPTSSVFTFGSSFQAVQPMIAYCFAEVPGYSRFGSYTGNGSADGPFVFCGFRPAYVMIKNTNGAVDWIVEDAARNPSNVVNAKLSPNTSGVEFVDATAIGIDFLSNGFKVRGTDAAVNGSNNVLIFAAFATAPQKFALAR